MITNRERLDQAVQKLSDATTELGYAIIQTDDSEDKSLLLAANVVLSTTIAAIHPAPDNAAKPGVDKLARTKLARMARAAESKAQQNRRTKRSEGGRLLTGMEAAIKTHLAPLVSGGRLLDRRTAVHQDSTLEGPLVQATWRLCKELDSAACASVLPRITWSREVVARVEQALIGDFDAQGNFNDAELITKHIIRAAHGPLSKLPCRPPYPTGSTVLSVAYLACAEVLCRLALGWPVPVNIIDLLAEFRCTTNGKPVPAGNGLLGALA